MPGYDRVESDGAVTAKLPDFVLVIWSDTNNNLTKASIMSSSIGL
jgi:hypothetical protein